MTCCRLDLLKTEDELLVTPLDWTGLKRICSPSNDIILRATHTCLPDAGRSLVALQSLQG